MLSGLRMATTARRGAKAPLTCGLGGQANFRDREHSHLEIWDYILCPLMVINSSPYRCGLDLQNSASIHGALGMADAGSTNVPVSAMSHQYRLVCRPANN